MTLLRCSDPRTALIWMHAGQMSLKSGLVLVHRVRQQRGLVVGHYEVGGRSRKPRGSVMLAIEWLSPQVMGQL